MANNSDDLRLGLRVDATATGLDQLDRTEQGVEGVRRASEQAGAAGQRFGAQVEAGAERAGAAAGGLRTRLTALASALAGAFAVDRIGEALRGVNEASERYAEQAARLRVATQAQYDFAQAQRDVYRIAQETRQPVEAITGLYAALAQRAGELKLQQSQIAAISEITAQSLRLSGTGAAAAEGATTQFIQALSAGVLRGEEFNSVLEQAPRLAQALAAGLGVPIGQLRALAEAGALTARTVVGALLTQRDQLAREYAELPKTVSGALTQLSNSWSRYIGEIDQASGIGARVAGAVKAAADSISTLVAAGGAGIAVAAAAGVQGLARWTVARREAAAAAAESVAVSEAEARAATQAAAAQLAAARGAQGRAVAELAETRAAQQLALAEAALAEQELLLAQGRTARAAASVRLATAEAALAAAQARTSAAAVAAGGAYSQVAAAQAAAAASSTASAAGVGLLGRALGVLGGPAGLLLSAVAGFAALRLAQRDVSEESREVERRLSAQATALSALAERQVQTARAAADASVRTSQQSVDEAQRMVDVRRRLVEVAVEEQLGDQQLVARQRELDEWTARLAIRTEALTGAKKQLSDIEAELTRRQNPVPREQAKVYAVLSEELGRQAQRLQQAAAAQQTLADADVTRAATLSRLAQLTGHQTDLETAARAAGEAGIAQAKARAAAEQQQLGIAEQQLAALIAEIGASDSYDAAKAKQLRALSLERDERAANLAALQAGIEGTRAEALAQQIAADSRRDHSGQVQALRKSYDEARVALDVYVQGEQLGTASAAQVAEARERLIVAEARYRDGLADTVTAAQLAVDAEQRRGQLAQAGVQVDIEAARAAQARARARGDDEGVARAALRTAKLEVDAADAAAAAKRHEAEAARRLAQALAAQVQANQDATPEDRARAQAAEDNAKALDLEADRLDQVTRQRSAAVQELRTQQEGLVEQAGGLARGGDTVAGSWRNADGTLKQCGATATETESGFKSLQNEVESLSTAAAGLFRDALAGQGFRELAGSAAATSVQAGLAKGGIDGLREALAALDAQQRTGSDATDSWIGRYVTAAQTVERQIIRTKLSVAETEDALRRATEAGTVGYDDVAAAAGRARSASDVLDEQDLSGLNSAIDAARQKLMALDEQAAETARSLRDALLQERGDQKGVEDSRFEQQKKALEDQLKAASAARSAAAAAELRQAIRDADELHRLKLQKIAEQSAAQQQRDADTAERQRQQAQSPTAGAGARAGAGAGAGPVFHVVLPDGGRINNIPQAGNADVLARLATAKAAAR